MHDKSAKGVEATATGRQASHWGARIQTRLKTAQGRICESGQPRVPTRVDGRGHPAIHPQFAMEGELELGGELAQHTQGRPVHHSRATGAAGTLVCTAMMQGKNGPQLQQWCCGSTKAVVYYGHAPGRGRGFDSCVPHRYSPV
eukprot:354973-Chlamydomonas_euryale.AAC.7